MLDTKIIPNLKAPIPLTHPVLPTKFCFRSGITAVLRWIKEDEYPKVYDMFLEAMKGGHGYTTDEYPTYEIFLSLSIDGNYCGILENAATGQMLAFLMSGTHPGLKRYGQKCANGSALINPKFRGLGIGSELMMYWVSALKAIGFEYMIADTALVNA